MGYRYNDKMVICPTFTRVVKTTHGKFIGIECKAPDINLGFSVNPVFRFDTSNELNDYIEIFCEDCYNECPYYKIYTNYGESN